MKTNITKLFSMVVFFFLSSAAILVAQEPTKGYNMYVPDAYRIPDELNTRLGTLKFDDGRPEKETAEKLYDYLLFSRATNVFLDNIPAVSTMGLFEEHKRFGVPNSNGLLIAKELVDSYGMWLTANTGTVYCSAFLDLEKDGPTVIEVPPAIGPGTLDDAWMRFVVDMGPVGLDRGKGGTYLILPPDYEGDIDVSDIKFPVHAKVIKMKIGSEEWDVIVTQSPTYRNWLILRGFLKDGKPDFSANNFATGVKIYPLSKADNPPEMKVVDFSHKESISIFPSNFNFFEMLNEVIQKEPVDAISPEQRGYIAAIGIEKGKQFNPDEATKKVLEEAARVGDAIGRTIVFSPKEDAFIWKDRYWTTGFIGGDYSWLKDGGNGGRYLDARINFYYGAIVNTPAMALKLVGKGSQYAFGILDKNKNYLKGGKHYKLHLDPNIPAKDFWSILAYDPQTRCILQTPDQPKPSVNNKRDKLYFNEDGSIDIYFGPDKPKDENKAANWIQTVPEKGWFVLFRAYGPTESWFDGSWKLNDFELIDKY
jgi:hypothetical protein